jgi:hypothetical protein
MYLATKSNWSGVAISSVHCFEVEGVEDAANTTALHTLPGKHAYGLLWTETHLTFYVDGDVVRTVGAWPCLNQEMQMIISVEVAPVLAVAPDLAARHDSLLRINLRRSDYREGIKDLAAPVQMSASSFHHWEYSKGAGAGAGETLSSTASPTVKSTTAKTTTTPSPVSTSTAISISTGPSTTTTSASVTLPSTIGSGAGATRSTPAMTVELTLDERLNAAKENVAAAKLAYMQAQLLQVQL